MNWGEIIKHRRAILKVSQQDLAIISGVSVRTIKTIEGGDCNPSIATLEKIGLALGLELRFELRKTI